MEKTNGGNLIQIKNLVATVNLNNGDTLVTVNKANMELKRGNSYAIVGKSGSGKTSLISIIAMLQLGLLVTSFLLLFVSVLGQIR